MHDIARPAGANNLAPTHTQTHTWPPGSRLAPPLVAFPKGCPVGRYQGLTLFGVDYGMVDYAMEQSILCADR